MPGASRLAELGTTTSGGPVSQRWRPPLGVSTTTVSGIVNRCRSASSRSVAEESAPDLVSRSMPIRWCGGSPQAMPYPVAQGVAAKSARIRAGSVRGVVHTVARCGRIRRGRARFGVVVVRGAERRELVAGERDDGADRARRRRGHGRAPGWRRAGRRWPCIHFRTHVRRREEVATGFRPVRAGRAGAPPVPHRRLAERRGGTLPPLRGLGVGDLR